MTALVAETFISLIELPEERRSGLDRRAKDVGSMEEKRGGEDRRKDFWPTGKPLYSHKCLNGFFDEFMSDHDGDIPFILVTDGKKAIKAPFRIIEAWLGWDLKKIDLGDIYVDPASRLRLIQELKDGEFVRFFPHVLKASGEKVVLDVLMTAREHTDGGRYFYCFVNVAD